MVDLNEIVGVGGLYQNELEKKARIIFVCSENTCRSPMAKFIMKKLVADVGLSEKIFLGCSAMLKEIQANFEN